MIVGRFQVGKIIRVLRRGGGRKIGKKGAGSGEWGVGNGDGDRCCSFFPTPHSPLPTPYYSLRDAELPEDEGVIEGHVVQAVVAARSPAVTARLQLDLEQEQVLVDLHLAQPGDIFSRLPVHHLGVVERGSD